MYMFIQVPEVHVGIGVFHTNKPKLVVLEEPYPVSLYDPTLNIEGIVYSDIDISVSVI